MKTLQDNVAANFRLGTVAEWEKHNLKLIENKFKEQEFVSADPKCQSRQKRGMNLAERRLKLQQLVESENAKYEQEIIARTETPAARRTRLEMRAKQLREKRLEQRKQFCEAARLKQFREQCDELRSNHGKNLLMECARVRKRQIEEKNLQQQLQSQGILIPIEYAIFD